MNFSQPKSYMYVKNEFDKCKDSESRAQWEKTGVHVFSIAETPPVLWKDSESRAQWKKNRRAYFSTLPRRREPRRNRNRMVERRVFCALEINLLLCKQYKTQKIQDHII